MLQMTVLVREKKSHLISNQQWRPRRQGKEKKTCRWITRQLWCYKEDGFESLDKHKNFCIEKEKSKREISKAKEKAQNHAK